MVTLVERASHLIVFIYNNCLRMWHLLNSSSCFLHAVHVQRRRRVRVVGVLREAFSRPQRMSLGMSSGYIWTVPASLLVVFADQLQLLTLKRSQLWSPPLHVSMQALSCILAINGLRGILSISRIEVLVRA